MESHRIKSLSLDPRSRNRFRFASSKQREQRATADVFRGYKRRIGVASSATREEAIHHTKQQEHNDQQQPLSKRLRQSSSEDDAKTASTTTLGSSTVASIADLQSASLAEELDLAHDRNASEVFGKFYRQIWPNVRSLPEILHHREKIVKLMMDFLLSPAEDVTSDEEGRVRFVPNAATTDILHLLAVLARDLRHELHPFLHSKILPRLVDDLLNPPLAKKQMVPLDVSIIEACIRSMSYCFRYDSESLVTETIKEGEEPCLEPMRQYYGKTLANRREVVRRLSAEALAPLIRRLKSESARKRHLKRIFRALGTVASDDESAQRAQENAADGIARLCLQLVKGVAGRLHSKADALVKTVLECCCANHDERKAAQKLLLMIGTQFLEELCNCLKTDVACSVFTHVIKLLDKYTTDKKESSSCLSIVKLANQMAAFDDGGLVRAMESSNDVLATLKKLFVPTVLQSLTPETRAASFDLICSVWRALAKEKNVTESVAKILETSIPVLLKDEGGQSFFLGLLTTQILPVLPVGLSMRALGSILLRLAGQESNQSFTFSLILALASAQEVQDESADETDTVLSLENSLYCEVTEETLESLANQCFIEIEDSFEGPWHLLSNAILCSAFVGMMALKRDSPKKEAIRRFKRTASWLQSTMETISSVERKRSENVPNSELALCFSLALDSLARCAAVAKSTFGQTNEALKNSLTCTRDMACSHLEAHSGSLWAVKSYAAFSREFVDIVGKAVMDDCDKAFDLLVPNLSCSNHFLRVHCLEILLSYPDKPFISDHADLDLTGDLDEEPSSAPSGTKSSFSGSCRILQSLMKIETITADLRNERKLISCLSTVEVFGRSSKMPVPYVEAAMSHMIGLLHVRFSPLWAAVQSAMISLIQGCGKYAWPYLQGKLTSYMSSSSPSTQLSKDEQLCVHDGVHLLQSFVLWDQTVGSSIYMFKKSVYNAEENGRVSRHLVRGGDDVVLSIWGTLEKNAQLVVTHSRDVMPIVLQFLSLHFFRENDPDAVEMKLSTHVQMHPSQREAETLSKKSIDNRMLAMLKVFAKVNGPQQMHKHKVLFQTFEALLGYSDILAQNALSSLLRFKPDYLVPYADSLKKLFAKGQLRQSLLQLKELKNNGTIPRDHRRKMVPILTRILLGRISSKNITRSAKDSPAARRTAIFSFLAGFCEGSQDELYSVVYLTVRAFAPVDVIREIEAQTTEDQDNFLERMRGIGSKELGALPVGVHEGFLNVLEAIVGQLGHQAIRFVPTFMSILLEFLKIYSVISPQRTDELDKDEDASDLPSTRSGRVRALCFRRLSELFDRFADVHDFSSDADRLWRHAGPSLSSLPESTASSDKSPSVMIFLRVLSSHSSLIPLLSLNREAVEVMVTSLAKANNHSAMDSILTFIENLLNLEDTLGEQKTPTGPKLVEENLESLLNSFKARMTRQNASMTLRREIRVLCSVSDLIASSQGISKCKTSTIDALAELLLRHIGAASKLSDQDKSNILSVIQTLVPGMSEEMARMVYQSLSLNLGPTKVGELSLATRFGIAQALHCIAIHHVDEAIPVAQNMLALCALNGKRVDELDYESAIKTLSALYEDQINVSWASLSASSTEWLTPIIQICFMFLQDNDGVLARTAVKALRALIELAASKGNLSDNEGQERDQWRKLLEGKLVPMTRSGLQMKTDSVRRLYIQLLSLIVKLCAKSNSPHLHGDLIVFMDDNNPDLDFFQGISHVQVHRRAKALTRFRRILDGEDKDTCRISHHSLSNVLLPLATHPIYESKSKEDDSYALEAVSAVGSIARLLSWSKYNNLVGTLLNQFQRHPEQEKYLVGTICSVLDNMDFDLSSTGTSNSDSNESAVLRTLERRIIPKTEELLTKEVKKSGKKEKTIRPSIVLALLKLAQKLPKEIFHMKLHRLLAVICDALKNRDSSIREVARATLARMAVSMDIEFLADIVRELAVSLKEGYQLHVRAASIHSILLEVSTKMSPEECLEESERGAFDFAVPALLDLIQEDLFGAAQERRDAEHNQVRFVKEAGGSKSMHSLELVASMISFDPLSDKTKEAARPTVHILVAPFLERLKSTGQSSKSIRRVKECLDRIVQGISKNKSLTAEKAFGFSYATVSHYVQQDPAEPLHTAESEDDGNVVIKPLNVSTSSGKISKIVSDAREENAGSLSEWRPSVLHMPKSDKEASEARRLESQKLRRVQDGSSAPKLTGSGRTSVASKKDFGWNDPAYTAAVVFGLQILQIALRKDRDQVELLDPFVPVLCDCICFSGDTEILRLAMKSLGSMLNVELNSLGKCATKLSSKTVDLLSSSGGNEELQHSCFKLLTHLLKANTSKTTSEESEKASPPIEEDNIMNDKTKMDTLLSYVRQSILESEQHSQAIALLKVVVSRRYTSPDLYDLMECILEQSVRSHKDSLRQQCSSVFLSFLLNYPMSEDRLEQELKQVILNVDYEFSDGRLSAIHLVQSIVSKLPVEMLEAKSQLFLLPLTMQLANDSSEDCRRAVGQCIKSLIGRVSVETCRSLFDYTSRWTKSSEKLLRRTALQLYGLFLEASPNFCRKGDVFDQLVSSIEHSLNLSGPDDWESIYFSLITLEKLFTDSSSGVLDGKHTILSTAVLDGLLHDHAWIQLVSTRLIWSHLKTLDPSSFNSNPQIETFLTHSGALFTVGRNLCAVLAQLDEETVNSNEDELVTIVIKSLTWVVSAMHTFPSLCFSKAFPNEDKSPVRWILKRLSVIAKPKSVNRRLAVFKCFASLIASCPQPALKENLVCMIEPLHRVELESQNDTAASQWQRDRENVTLSEEAELAQEVLQMLESKFDDIYLGEYTTIRKKAKSNKEDRKRQEKAQAARDPKYAAEQKIQKQMQEKKRRKRRVEERRKDRGGGSAKRSRHVGNYED